MDGFLFGLSLLVERLIEANKIWASSCASCRGLQGRYSWVRLERACERSGPWESSCLVFIWHHRSAFCSCTCRPIRGSVGCFHLLSRPTPSTCSSSSCHYRVSLLSLGWETLTLATSRGRVGRQNSTRATATTAVAVSGSVITTTGSGHQCLSAVPVATAVARVVVVAVVFGCSTSLVLPPARAMLSAITYFLTAQSLQASKELKSNRKATPSAAINRSPQT